MSTLAQIRAMARTSDVAFALYVSNLFLPPHLAEASRFADRNAKGIVIMPRGHAKTTLFIHRAARRIGQSEGRRRLGVLTAVESDAENRSAAIRRIVESERFAEVFPWARSGVRGPDWTDAQWTVRGVDLRQDATCIARGLRSIRAGARLDDLLADDMVGLQENTTPGMREHASRTYWSVVDPMVVPGGTRWFLGTRWHEDDLYAELIRKQWPALQRRAIEDDAALWPEQWPLDALEHKREEMGTPLFNLQMQNDPSGIGGNVFRSDWFQYVHAVPDGLRRVGLDLNASTNERSDYTAAVETVEDADHNLYVVGAWRAQLAEGHREWLTGIRDGAPSEGERYVRSDGPRLLWPTALLPAGHAGWAHADHAARPLVALTIESTVFQSTFTREMLARTRLPARAVHPDRDKVMRARALAARYEGRKVFHLRGAPGIDSLESELVAFPNGQHDDQVDAAVYAADLTSVEFSFVAGRR